MYKEATIFVSSITILFSLFGVFLFIKLLSIWKNIDIKLIKARIFLSKGFVMKNIVVIFTVGLLMAMHNLIRMLYPEFYLEQILSSRLFAISELLVALLSIEWLMYNWIKITK